MDASDYSLRKARRRIYLLRHGEVSYFDAAGKPHHPGTVPLNTDGVAQVEAASRELAAAPFDRAVSSTLLRSVETAKTVIGDRSVPLETRAEIREIQPGRLADIPPDSVEQVFVGAFGRAIGRKTQFLGGETFGSLQDRVLACFGDLLADPDWRNLLIVAHGGVNRVILAHALGVELKGAGAMEQDAGCINIIDVDSEGRFLVRLVNHTPSNPVKIGIDLTTMERIYLEYRRGL
jgi:broad specificity phosphatase PhoE